MLRHCPVCGEAIYIDDGHELYDDIVCEICGVELRFVPLIEYGLKLKEEVLA